MNSTAPQTASIRAWIALALFSIAYFFSLLDRQILTVLVDPVKADLGISDKQFGLLQGLAFALFYTTFGIPMAWLADRWNRKFIITGGLALWSLCTVLAGFARSFTGLFAARIGVGLGEGCLAPPAYSVLSDSFRPALLGRAIGILHTVGALGIAGSALIGGMLYKSFSSTGPHEIAGHVMPAWGMTLVAVGVPGVILALIILLVVREPVRTGSKLAAQASSSDYSSQSFTATLMDRRGFFVRLLAGSTLLAVASNSVMTWAAAYMMRVFTLEPAEAGVRLAVAFGVGAILGPLLGGTFSDVLYKRYSNLSPVIVLTFSCAAFTLACTGLLIASSADGAVIVIILLSIFISSALATTANAIQLAAPASYRARMSAVWLCCNNLIGLSVGSFVVGALNDELGATAVGTSLGIVTIASSLPATLLIASLLRPVPEPARGMAT